MHSGVWRQFAQQLAADGYQVICVDLPGHGRSGSVAPYTLENIAAALLKAMPVAEFSLLGWSLGATVALEMCRQQPQRIEQLFILSGNPCFVQRADWPGVQAEVLAAFMAQLQKNPAQLLARFLALQVNLSPQTKPVLAQLKAAMQEYAMPQVSVLHSGLQILAESDLRVQLAGLACPVLVMVGDRDGLVPLASAEAVKTLQPAAKVQVIAGGGHVLFLTHPQALRELLRAAMLSGI
jgi:pimeloyl-[acyl-carrier protein] methyl ester esterase